MAEALNAEEDEANLAHFSDLQVNFRSRRLNKILMQKRVEVSAIHHDEDDQNS